jgi:hypothetical protein
MGGVCHVLPRCGRGMASSYEYTAHHFGKFVSMLEKETRWDKNRVLLGTAGWRLQVASE